MARGRVLKADLALVGVTAIWGSTFVIVKAALRDAAPLVFNAIRLSLGALLLALLFHRDLRRLPAEVVRGGVVLGLFLAAGYAFQTSGLAYTSASKSAFITGLSVIIVPFLMFGFLGRRLAWNTIVGAGVAVVGLYFLAFAGEFPAGAGLSRATLGDLLTLACACAFAAHIVAMGEYCARFRYQPLAVLQLGIAALFTWIAAPLVGPLRLHLSAPLAGAIGVTAIGATALAFTVQAWAQQFTPATHTAIVFSLEPVFAWFTSLVWLHERLRTKEMVGASLTLAAVFICELAHPSEIGVSAAPAKKTV